METALDLLSITVHGSILRNPHKARDIDVVATQDLPEVREIVSEYRKAQGWPDLPLDIQFGHVVPQLPFCEPSRTVPIKVGSYRFDLSPKPQANDIKNKTMWDLAAWARAIEKQPSVLYILLESLRAEKKIDSRRVDADNPRAILVPKDAGFSAAYHGGGPRAMQTARYKAPNGWCWLMGALHPKARDLVERITDGADLPDWFAGEQGYRTGAPAASAGELVLYADGIDSAYGEFLPW